MCQNGSKHGKIMKIICFYVLESLLSVGDSGKTTDDSRKDHKRCFDQKVVF